MTETGENTAMQPREMIAILKRINRRSEDNWDDWVRLGLAIVERQRLARRRAGGTTRGPIYAQQLGRAMGQFYDHYKRLSDNGTVSALVRCVEQIDAVNAWRSREAVENRLTSPRRVWEGYQESLRSSIDFTQADANADADDDDEDGDARTARRPGGGARRSNSEAELLAEIETLREQLDEHRMTIYPEMNAQRIWRRLVEVVGADKAGTLALATATQLDAIGNRLVEAAREWDAAAPADQPRP